MTVTPRSFDVETRDRVSLTYSPAPADLTGYDDPRSPKRLALLLSFENAAIKPDEEASPFCCCFAMFPSNGDCEPPVGAFLGKPLGPELIEANNEPASGAVWLGPKASFDGDVPSKRVAR